MTHLQESTSHVNRTQSRRTGFDSSLQIFVESFDNQLGFVRCSDFKSTHSSVAKRALCPLLTEAAGAPSSWSRLARVCDVPQPPRFTGEARNRSGGEKQLHPGGGAAAQDPAPAGFLVENGGAADLRGRGRVPAGGPAALAGGGRFQSGRTALARLAELLAFCRTQTTNRDELGWPPSRSSP